MNSVFAQYEELSSPQFAVINLSLRLRLITANFGLDNSSYRAQPHSIIVKYSVTDLIFTNTKIIDKSNHWSLILYQESIAINRMKPSLNHGTKASKDLSIFN